ncbi:hypothetical protein niasHT_020458 [Heterodera trifolii]|uniref:Methyltransferase-like protein 13 n=1 Tax=Heterodera trifolii TaxID=157864 RepID=A0ABD2JGL5_9BILA
MEEYEASSVRQRAKIEERDGKRAKANAQKAPKNSGNSLQIGWIVCFVLFTFTIGILMYQSRETPTNYQKEVNRECDEETGQCIAIVDYTRDSGKTWNRGIFYVNETTFDFEKMYEKKIGAEAILKCPANADAPEGCVPDHGRLSWPYVATMAIMPFVVGALHHPTQMQQRTQSALVIGMGGGTLDMFLHTKTPNLNITIYELDPMVVQMADKWFGTVEDSTRRTIVEDGIFGIEKAAENGEQFDLVALDACEMFSELICPVSVFSDEKILQKIKAILKPTGAFAVNVLMQDEKQEDKYVAEQKRKLLNTFPICLHTSFVRELAHVFVCFPTKINVSGEHAKLSKEWEKKREELAKEFGIDELLTQYRIS